MSFRELLTDDEDGGVRGVAAGVVTDNQDPEGMGRVKVKLTWRDVEDESHWARVATLMAGPERGTYFLPEVDDEVLVAFEDGDVHHPYVLGSLWNGADAPPEENASGSNDVRLVRSRSGHELAFDDADSGGGITITTAGGHTVALDDAGGTVTVEDGNGTVSLILDSAGSLAIESTQSLSVKSTNLTLEGTNVTVDAKGTLRLKGGMVFIN